MCRRSGFSLNGGLHFWAERADLNYRPYLQKPKTNIEPSLRVGCETISPGCSMAVRSSLWERAK